MMPAARIANRPSQFIHESSTPFCEKRSASSKFLFTKAHELSTQTSDKLGKRHSLESLVICNAVDVVLFPSLGVREHAIGCAQARQQLSDFNQQTMTSAKAADHW